MFGMERLAAALRGCRGQAASDIHDCVIGQIHAFTTGADQFDDITLLVARREIHP
jgi:serine phosphatase RsbU (regulator of sigma subunit)